MKQTRRHVISVALVLALAIGLVGYTFLFHLKPKLGLDLRGGLSVTLTAPPGTRSDLLDKAVDILRGRVDQAGVAEPEISRESNNNIFIQLPGTEDPQRLLRLIGKTAQLQFRQVLNVVAPEDPAYKDLKVSPSDDPTQPAVLLGKDKSKYQVGPAEVTGEAVSKGTARLSAQGAWEVLVDLKRAGTDQMTKVTARLACEQGFKRRMAIVLDGQVDSSPPMAPDVICNQGITGGKVRITGNFSDAEAKDLALVLTAGALPVKLTQSEVRTVSATLGSDSLKAGLIAGAIGLVLVMLYMLVYYRTLGLQTWFGLLVFASINYGLIVVFGKLIGWNLTLAGIAGLIVAIGIAADSYIVFFERIKEEIHQGRSLRASIDKGFGHAWRTMRTANTVTILAALVLYFLAVGPVRGFALALGMATLLDLFVTYTLTWPLAALLAKNKFFAENRIMGMKRALEGGSEEGSVLRKFYRSEFKVDFIGRRRMWLGISASMVLISALALIPGIRGLHYGIDFEGGTLYRAPSTHQVQAANVTKSLEASGLQGPIVQISQNRTNGGSVVEVQTPKSLSPDQNDKVLKAIESVTGTPSNKVNVESVGKKWGASITTKALRGLVVFILLTIVYMSVRLEPKMAAAGIVALIHDLMITAGVYALVGFEVSPATVIATLTILGFSLYDTIVVFDKVQENQALPSNARKTFAQIANDSSNQVLMRSLSTSLTVLLPVGSLLFIGSILFGAETLKDLALALFVGVAVGTYSSIFLATPLLTIWKEKEPKYASMKAKSRRESGLAAPAKAAVNDDDEDEDYDEEDEPVTSAPARTSQAPRSGGSRTTTASRTQPRKNVSRAKRKGKKR